MKHLASVTLIGKDKRGVIAMVTQFLLSTQANIESLEEQVSRGRFRMTLQASWKDRKFNESTIRSGLDNIARKLEMQLGVHFLLSHSRQRMAILVTKESHVLESLLKAIRTRQIAADPVVIVSNRTDLQPIAKKAGLSFKHIPYNDRAEAEANLQMILREHKVDFVVLARFMKILSPDFVWNWKNKIINIHPSLLPSFPGASAYRQAYEKGVKIIGVTSHFVTPDLDQGPIIWQECFRVKSKEKLSEIVGRGQILECKCLIKAIQLFLKKRMDVHWGQVFN